MFERLKRLIHEVMIRHLQTGEPQAVTAPPDWSRADLVNLYVMVGDVERAIPLLAEHVTEGNIGTTALGHVLSYRELIGDHPEYLALLDGAGIIH